MQYQTKIFSIVSFLVQVSLISSAQTKSLFTGKDLGGWHVDVPEMDANAKAINPFVVRNRMLVSLGTPNGHLITDSVYKDYRLVVEYRFPGKPDLRCAPTCIYAKSIVSNVSKIHRGTDGA